MGILLRVYRLQYTTTAQFGDEIMRYHDALWIELVPLGPGHIIHVRGGISRGFVFDAHIHHEHFSTSSRYTFHELVGYVDMDKINLFVATCRQIPTPPIQANYAENALVILNPGQSLYTCTEWIEDVIRHVRNSGLLTPVHPSHEVHAIWKRREQSG